MDFMRCGPNFNFENERIDLSNMGSEYTVATKFTFNTHCVRTMFKKCKIGKKPGQDHRETAEGLYFTTSIST